MPTRTKIEVSPALTRRMSGLDDLAHIVFPDNRLHRRVFVAIWVELKYAEEQFLPSLAPLCGKHGFSERTLHTVRAKLKRLGLLKRVSRFDRRYGNAGGWTFSDRFSTALSALARMAKDMRIQPGKRVDEQKDRDSMMYV